MALDIDRFVELSGAVKIDDLDWEGAAAAGVTDEEARILRYMADTETHTIIYLRDLLAGHSTKDPEITAFLSVWVYEELWHGRAIDKVLRASGREVNPLRAGELIGTVTWMERLEAFLSALLANSTPHFIATHMAWGALNEFTAAASYMALARRTQNPAVRELCKRMAEQERKHFAFYFEQAKKRLERSRLARVMARFALTRLWSPVGGGVSGAEALPMVAEYLFGDEQGWEDIVRAEKRMNQLPGIEEFCEPTRQIRALIDRHRALTPALA
jgi:hypothetical protein